MKLKKSEYFKRTLVIIFVVLSCVNSRPQDDPPSATALPEPGDTQEELTRYKYRNRLLNNYYFKLPLVSKLRISNSRIFKDHSTPNKNLSTNATNNFNVTVENNIADNTNLSKNRQKLKRDVFQKHESENITAEILKTNLKHETDVMYDKQFIEHHLQNKILQTKNIKGPPESQETRKPIIKKIITKWSDLTNYDGYSTNHHLREPNNHYKKTHEINNVVVELNNFTSVNNDMPSLLDENTKSLTKANHEKKYYKPQQQFIDPGQVQTNQIYIIDKHPLPSTRPTFVYSRPTPTPVITNIGTPTHWPQQQSQLTYQTPSYSHHDVYETKPVKHQYQYHRPSSHNYPQYSESDYEVTTFQPANSYTEKIVIRPDEFSDSLSECPTIYLTLNNTFQGQAKEVCPDLNIAVNTNVVNKNNVVESEEDDSDSFFPGIFSLPIDDSSSAESPVNDYTGSEEGQDELSSSSIENFGLSNYNAANTGIQSDYSEPETSGSNNSPLTSFYKPSRPSNDDDDDDIFNVSSFVKYFRPAFNALGWLATLNPFNHGIFSFFLAPLIFLFAGAYGLISFFIPWVLPNARQAPSLINLGVLQFQWDNFIASWNSKTYVTDETLLNNKIQTTKSTDSSLGSNDLANVFKKIMRFGKTLLTLRKINTTDKGNQGYARNKRKKR